MRFRTPAAFLLSALLAAICNQSPSVGQVSKDQPKDPPKEPSKEPTKSPSPWPTVVAGRDLSGWLKDVTNPDPTIRDSALHTIPVFGPEVQARAGKLLVARLTAEKDAGVRLTLLDTIAVVGVDDKDKLNEEEALRLIGIMVDTSLPGSATRQRALRTLGAFGPLAYKQVERVTGQALVDTSYETRRQIANTLGRIGFSEIVGPSHKALVALSGTLSRDVSVSVRLEALQSLVLLGPPWAKIKDKATDPTPPIKQIEADVVADHMRHRLGMAVGKGPIGKPPKDSLEPDKQLEIWCRVVLMRFDPKEINPANLGAIALNIKSADRGPRVQALQALILFSEDSAGEIDKVMPALDDEDPLVLSTALGALGSMGVKALGAIPRLEELQAKWKKSMDDKMREMRKNQKFVEVYDKATAKEKEQINSTFLEEQTRMSIAQTIAWIKKSKKGMPGGDPKEKDKDPEPKKP